jgi:hypothetical protein
VVAIPDLDLDLKAAQEIDGIEAQEIDPEAQPPPPPPPPPLPPPPPSGYYQVLGYRF